MASTTTTTKAAEAFAKLIAPYEASTTAYDEFKDTDGAIRPRWRTLADGLGGFSEEERQARFEVAQRLINENGVTYNVYTDEENRHRPWSLDALPFVLDAADWLSIEVGLIQRARLLNAILKDIYSEQTLIKGGALPAALILGNPNFLRPCVGWEPIGGHLSFYAADLARSPDGQWWVLSDRTQAPSGAGYALENRIIVSRALPDLYRNAQVHRLAHFFQAYLENILKRIPRDEPQPVLLTPGPYNEAYFEHAYLARYLGIPLVEGADLTVRDDLVYMKSVDGLKRVDLILRRLDADYADPLELRADSRLGVAGLTQAARKGNVMIANALGSGVVETDGLKSFLPSLCQSLLGEELLLPSVATWWAGQTSARNYIVENLDNLSVRNTHEPRGLLSPALAQPDSNDLEALLLQQGYDYAAQERVALSSAPVMRENGIEAAPIVMRVFLAANGDSFQVMPGGLARVSSDPYTDKISMQSGVMSKDVWVLSDMPVDLFSLLRPPGASIQLRRSRDNLPSRAADNMFWLGRYIERVEATARLLRAVLRRVNNEQADPSSAGVLRVILQVLIERGQVTTPTAADTGELDFEVLSSDLTALLYTDAPSGIGQSLLNLRSIGEILRDRLSQDAWRSLNALTKDARRETPPSRLNVTAALERLDEIIIGAASVYGIIAESMTRTAGWRFADMGIRLERAMHLTDYLRVLLSTGDPEADGSLSLLLELADSFMTYRARYLATPQLEPVLDLLMADSGNPRSLAFQMESVDAHLERLPQDGAAARMVEERRLITKARTDIQLADVFVLCKPTEPGARRDLENFLTRISSILPDVSDLLAARYFSHAETRRTTFAPRGEPEA